MSSKIEWTDETWNPTVGCSRVSAGCEHCYAERVAHRGMSASHKGLTVMGKRGPRWTGEVRLMPERLGQPLRWRKPRKVFVDSMSDLFHVSVPFEYIAAVFGVMAACPQHTFQVLTKRPERAREWFDWMREQWKRSADSDAVPVALRAAEGFGVDVGTGWHRVPWPLPNVWLGTSVEDQPSADRRITELMECPAAVRWISAEPLLERVLLRQEWLGFGEHEPLDRRLDWVVIGGESGPKSRPFNLQWAIRIIDDCRQAGIPVFMKQVGARPYSCAGHDCPAACNCGGKHECDGEQEYCTWTTKDRKGGKPDEWPPRLRIQQFPDHEVAK